MRWSVILGVCAGLAGLMPQVQRADGVAAVAQNDLFERPSQDEVPDDFLGEIYGHPPVIAALFPQVKRTPGWWRVTQAATRTRHALREELLTKGLIFGDPVFVRIFKEERSLEVWVRRRDSGKYELFRSWPVAAWGGTLGPKQAEGDGQSPEGFYSVPRARLQPNTHNHLAFNIGYPNAYDRLHGRTGSSILVHGNEVSVGCFAMTDARIEEIYTVCAAALSNGQRFFRVHVFPFRMTAQRMASASGQPWEEFWRNLKEGYDFFETEKIPPEVTVENFRYAFKPEAPIALPLMVEAAPER